MYCHVSKNVHFAIGKREKKAKVSQKYQAESRIKFSHFRIPPSELRERDYCH